MSNRTTASSSTSARSRRCALLIAAFLIAGTSIAQDQNATSSDSLLGSGRLRELVATATTPEEYRELRDHFVAVAADHETQARRYAAFTDAYRSSPNRHQSDFGAHYVRLAELSRASATAARQVADYYGGLPAAVPSTPSAAASPVNSAADKELLQLVATAHLPGEHAQLRQYFSTLAAKYRSDADAHAAAAQALKTKNRAKAATDAAAHCERLAQVERTAAKTAETLATEHQKLEEDGVTVRR